MLKFLAVLVFVMLAMFSYAFAADVAPGISLPQGWDGQVALLVAWIVLAIPFLKTLPYIGKFIQGQVAVVCDYVAGVVFAGVRCYWLHDPLYGTSTKAILIILIGLVAGYTAANGYKFVSGLVAKASNTNGG